MAGLLAPRILARALPSQNVVFQWRFRRVLLGDSCEYSYGFVSITRTVFPIDPSRGPSARTLVKEFHASKRHTLRRI